VTHLLSVRKGKGKTKRASSSKAESKAKTAKISASKKRLFSKSTVFIRQNTGTSSQQTCTSPSADQNQAEKLQKELKEMKEMISKCET